MIKKFFARYMIRWKRFLRHLLYPLWKHPLHLSVKSPYVYVGDLFYYILDLIFISDLYITINKIIKPNIRKLNETELLIANSFYGGKINFEDVIIDDKSWFLTRKFNFAYVSFNLINYWDNIADHVFIHELIHIHQYDKFGIVYIFRALLAQSSKEGYNYGGHQGLKKAIKDNKSFYDFNFEQQAAIIEHYYLITNREDLRDNEDLVSTYSFYFEQL